MKTIIIPIKCNLKYKFQGINYRQKQLKLQFRKRIKLLVSSIILIEIIYRGKKNRILIIHTVKL